MKRKHMGKRREDYLETILLLSITNRVVRIKDIADKLSLTKPTVASMIAKLTEEGLLKHEKYGDVLLSEKGKQIAKKVYQKHVTIHSFLKSILQLPEDISEKDACNLEHYISNITIERLIKFIAFFHNIMKNNDEILNKLNDCYKSNSI